MERKRQGGSNFEVRFFLWLASHPDISELLTQFKLVYEETENDIIKFENANLLEALLIARGRQELESHALEIDDFQRNALEIKIPRAALDPKNAYSYYKEKK